MPLEAKPLVQPAVQLSVGPPQVLAAGRVFDHRPELLEVELRGRLCVGRNRRTRHLRDPV